MIRLIGIPLIILSLVACGDVETDEPEPVNVGEQQRQACVDKGYVALIENNKMVGCVSVEQYQSMLSKRAAATP